MNLDEGIPVSTTTRIEVPARLAGLFTLGRLLERLERSREPVAPDQYRMLVERLYAELAGLRMDEAASRVLALLPATAELYENLQYAHAGLCRSPLKPALESEIAARDLFARLAARPDNGLDGGQDSASDAPPDPRSED